MSPISGISRDAVRDELQPVTTRHQRVRTQFRVRDEGPIEQDCDASSRRRDGLSLANALEATTAVGYHACSRARFLTLRSIHTGSQNYAVNLRRCGRLRLDDRFVG